MRATEQIGRYRLLDLVTQDEGVDGQQDVYLWHGYDETLDRAVALRILNAADPRCPAVVGAAQAAARVDDRRLLRVLDVLDLPATATDPARIAVVSEWASGRNLERTIMDRGGTPFAPAEALSLVADVARALAAGTTENVSHGRLRPSSVFITDAGEVRIRGLAVDAALFGVMPALADKSQADVDALGSLLYLLSTGYWPGPNATAAPSAPRAGDIVLPPSQVRAAVPRGIDDAVARSVSTAARQRGVVRVSDVVGFATMIGATLDHVAPVSTTTIRVVPSSPGRRTAHLALRWTWRLLAVAAGVALIAGIAWVGWQLATRSSSQEADASNAADAGLLTSSAKPVEDTPVTGLDQVFTIERFRSYDPYGDDDGNGKPDRRRGLEGEDLVATVNDADPDTAWLTGEYTTADLDGKQGVGLILDLGEARDVQQVSLKLVGIGTDVDVRIADRILSDPALWTPLATAIGANTSIDVRAPRPVTGRYVLIWLTRLPPMPDRGPGHYQGGVKGAVVSG